MAGYGKWNGHRHTDKRASPTKFRQVQGVRAIRVCGATYRNCVPIDGVFELVTAPKDTKRKPGMRLAEVKCSWFGVKPRTCYPHLTVDPARYEILENFEGEVIDEIGNPRVISEGSLET